MELELINLKKTYGTVQALKGINYKFTSGIYGILGSNGAGKSTMINLITDNISRDKINGGSILYSQDKEKKDILKLGKNFRKIVFPFLSDTLIFFTSLISAIYLRNAIGEKSS